MSTTNIDRAKEMLRNTGLSDTAATSAVSALAAHNLITPDLPEPDESDNIMVTWNVDNETSVSSTPDGCIMVMRNQGMVGIYSDMDEVRDYAMKLFAAAKQSKKKIAQMNQIFGQMGNQASSAPATSSAPAAPAAPAPYPYDKENEFVTDAIEAAADEPGATADSIVEARDRAKEEFFQQWKNGKFRD